MPPRLFSLPPTSKRCVTRCFGSRMSSTDLPWLHCRPGIPRSCRANKLVCCLHDKQATVTLPAHSSAMPGGLFRYHSWLLSHPLNDCDGVSRSKSRCRQCLMHLRLRLLLSIKSSGRSGVNSRHRRQSEILPHLLATNLLTYGAPAARHCVAITPLTGALFSRHRSQAGVVRSLHAPISGVSNAQPLTYLTPSASTDGHLSRGSLTSIGKGGFGVLVTVHIRFKV